MRRISEPVQQAMNADPAYKKCMRRELLHDHECKGRITREHAIIYAGNQVDAVWAIIPICAYAHSVDEYQDGGILDKKINEWIALNRASDADILEMTGESEVTPLSKAIYYTRRRAFLNTLYAKATA